MKEIELLQKMEPKGGYDGCFSGGKDSIVIKHLCNLANVKVEWHYHKTTIDPPELIKFIKRNHSDVIWNRPKHGNFFNRMEKKGFPTRKVRWCCSEYKEIRWDKNAVVVMGIRAEESPKRAKNWREITKHFKYGNLIINPIFWWSSERIWNFIKSEDIPYCELYDQGYKRLGCIGCPSSGKSGRLRDFKRWPAYERKWKRAFKKIWDRRKGTLQRDGREWFGTAHFDNWEEMWVWWLYNHPLPNKKQLKFKFR